MRCLCASFPTVTWLQLNERILCGVAYVLLKEREPDLWDDEKVAMLPHSSLYTASITLSSSFPSETTINTNLPCVCVTLWYSSALSYIVKIRKLPQFKCWPDLVGRMCSPWLLRIHLIFYILLALKRFFEFTDEIKKYNYSGVCLLLEISKQSVSVK